MEKIDQMLDRWIYNSIIRTKLRKLIIKAINENTQKSQNAVNALHFIGGVDGKHIIIYPLKQDY
tara:strand:- start:420 stop:611 length:192 start_codon:yes stop_codon:yes gene_type:complete